MTQAVTRDKLIFDELKPFRGTGLQSRLSSAGTRA